MLRVGRPQDGVRDPKVHPALSDLRLTDHLDEDAATKADATAEPPASPQRGSTATATDA